jgi:hypothetical protein
MAPVIDSWMESDITVPHSGHTVKIKALKFSPVSATEEKVLSLRSSKIGLFNLKLRNEVYGDAQYRGVPFYHVDDCKEALASQ